jgi:hypothetical protein
VGRVDRLVDVKRVRASASPYDARDHVETIRYPVVVFEDASRIEREFQSTDAWTPRSIGTEVPVLYRPERPEAARNATFLGLFGNAIMFAATGAGVLAGSAWLPRPRRPRPSPGLTRS